MANIKPTGIAVPKGAVGDVRNLATQVRAQSTPVVADAILNLQMQIDQHAASISNVSSSLAKSVAPPTPGSNPAAPYTNLPTGFAISNSRYDLNASGQQVLKLDAVWVKPTDVRYGGSYIVRQKPSDATPTLVMELNAAATTTLIFSDFPTSTENWQFWLISQDTSGNLNTHLTAPVAGTPTTGPIAISPPPSGASGTEYCANVLLGFVTQSAPRDSNGVIQNLVTANYTPPADPKFGTVEIRVYNGVVLVGKNSSVKSPATISFPNPNSALTYTVKLVSLDVNGRANSEQVSTPQTTISVGVATGTLDLSYYLPSTFASFMTIVSLNITGLLTAVAIKVINYLGSGIVTDITQGFDATAGINTGIAISLSAQPSSRLLLGPAGLFIFDQSNNTKALLRDNSGGSLTLYNASGVQGIALTGASSLVQVSTASSLGAKMSVSGTSGYHSMFWGGTEYFAPGVNVNGKRMAWGSSGNFNGGTPAQATVSTGLTTVENFVVTVVGASGAAESAKIISASGGNITFESSLPGSTSGFNWDAKGT